MTPLVLGAVNPLLFLLLLACPIGMGLMMLFMGRGMGMGRQGPPSDSDAGGDGSLPDLKAEQARIAERIEALEQREEERREPTQAS